MKKVYLLVPLFLLLVGCHQKIVEEDLIGGTWMATTGYQNGEVKEGHNCYPFHEGVEFKDDSTAYVKVYERNFEYELNDRGKEIVFRDSGPADDSTNENEITTYHRYKVKKISDDEIALEGQGLAEGNSCVLERK